METLAQSGDYSNGQVKILMTRHCANSRGDTHGQIPDIFLRYSQQDLPVDWMWDKKGGKDEAIDAGI